MPVEEHPKSDAAAREIFKKKTFTKEVRQLENNY
jgi:hypothetical protein